MLAKQYRLRKNFQFKYIYSKGKSVACKHFVLLYTPAKSNSLRIGISVSNKIGKAVLRNRIKRLIREAVRLNIKTIARAHNIVIAASSKFNFELSTPYVDIEKSLKYCLSKAGIYKP